MFLWCACDVVSVWCVVCCGVLWYLVCGLWLPSRDSCRFVRACLNFSPRGHSEHCAKITLCQEHLRSSEIKRIRQKQRKPVVHVQSAMFHESSRKKRSLEGNVAWKKRSHVSGKRYLQSYINYTAVDLSPLRDFNSTKLRSTKKTVVTFFNQFEKIKPAPRQICNHFRPNGFDSSASPLE